MEINKNISVWRGNNTPPTDFHIWEKEDGSIHTKINESWYQLTSPSDKSTLDRIEKLADKLNRLQIKEVDASGSNILKSYQLQVDGESFGINIDIPKDKALKDIKIGYENATVDEITGEINIGNSSTEDPQYMIYSLAIENGTYKMVKVDLSKFISEKEYSDGLEIDGSKLKVKKDSSSESYLSISADGIKISGLNSKFDDLNTEISDINKVLYTQHSEVILSCSPTIIEKGISTKITLSWKYLFNSEETTPTSMQLKSGSTILESDNKSYTDNITNNKSYYVLAINGGIPKNSNTITVNAYYPMYFGEGGSSFDKNELITTTNKRPIASSPNGNINITFTGNKYLWLCVPSSMSVNKVTSSGFSVPMESPITQTINESYKCYRSTDTINAGTVNFVIS